MNNNDEVFTSYTGMNDEEIRKLINDKINILQEKLNGNINEGEKENYGYLVWDCKMLLKNIYMSCDKLINKYSSSLNSDELLYFSNIEEILKNDENNWNNIDSIRKIFDRIKNYKSQNNIGMVSINGIKINDKATDNMKNLVLDSKIPYEYNKVHFSIDDNDVISQIIFYTVSSNDETYGIKEAQILYGQNKLITVEDFNKFLGIGKEEIDERNSLYKYINYNEGNYELILTIYDDRIINVEIKKH